MKLTAHTRRILAARRQARRLKAAGYEVCEPRWEIISGGRHREVILDVVISTDGKRIFTKIGPPPKGDKL